MSVNAESYDAYKNRTACYAAGIKFHGSDLTGRITCDHTAFKFIEDIRQQHGIIPFILHANYIKTNN